MPQSPQPPGTPRVADPSEFGPPPDPIAPLRAALRGHYDIGREIGQGAFATVYLAQDLKHERKVALKVLLADPTSDTGELRFIREIRLLARLQHPNILPLHDSGHVEALLYYVMPYVAGETLRDRINRERQLETVAACKIARDVADALAYAHAQGVVHRDIKPENILLSAGHPILADFGIARAIDLAGVRQLTRTGAASPGTPAYMSPEQLMGDRELDGRSDTYSLGCVLFEMLTGTPPFSGKEGFVKRFTEPPPLVSSVRKGLPVWVDDVVSKALARNQSDRFQTAEELATALGRASGARASSRVQTGAPSPTTTASAKPGSASGVEHSVLAPESRQRAPTRDASDRPGPARAPIRQRAVWLDKLRSHATAVAVVTALILLAAVATARGRVPSWRSAFFGSGVDSTRIALVPFGGSAPRADRDRIVSRIYTALSEWHGLHLASDQDVADAAAGETPKSTRAAAELAKRVGAGSFIWGQIGANDPSQVRVELFDVSSGVSRKTIAIRASADSSALSGAVRDLLKDSNRPSSADGGDGKTKSFEAWRAYGRGHLALANGDFIAAEQNFRNATSADPDFGPARVWLAQTLAWRSPDSRGDWREQVAQGMGAASGLSDRDRLVGTAVSQIADRRYPEACTAYSRLSTTDSLDFVGFFGLGQCRALDSLVIRSSASPSGWRFRSRYSEAADAFMRALSINPNAHSILSFEQLQDLLPTGTNKTRRGHNIDGVDFAAYPALIRDTVVFVPFPLAEFASLPAERTAAARDSAIEADLDALYDFATDWTRRAPTSSAAFVALADVLEGRGEIDRSRSGSLSAIDAVVKARQTAVTPDERQLAGSKEAWLRFKQGDFARARSLADSLLPWPAKRRDEARALIGLAALTGKIGKTSELARVTHDYANSASNLPVPIMDAAAPFFAFAALGVCTDTTRAVEQRLDDALGHYVAESQEAELKRAVKSRPLSMLAPCTGGQSSLRVEAGSSRLLNLQQAFARSDRRTLNTLLAKETEDARTQRPGDIALEHTYQVAWLRSAMGDTAGAERLLDRALGALPSLSAVSLRDATSAAAAVRAMALRAELANARGETEDRRKWARAVADLWATADSPLQPTVTRMRTLAAQQNPK